MTLKINYLDHQNSFFKNRALFLMKDTKIDYIGRPITSHDIILRLQYKGPR